MSDIQEYKCSACGGIMEFDSKTQKMKCPYCGTEMSVDEFEKANVDNSQPQNDVTFESAGGGAWEAGETDGMKVYECQSCGGEIIADESTGASICPYCGNKVVMKQQFSGDLKPDFIIPFKYDKKAAKEAYTKHLKDKAFLPRIFKSQNHIDEIKGVYVPYWLFNADVSADVVYNAEKLRTWRQGNTEYTEHNYYEAVRSGTMGFDHIPEDGSEKMDDTLMEAIEPFDFKDAVPFKTAYMAGYMADRYDVQPESRVERAKERIKESAEDELKKTVKGYDVVSVQSSFVNPINANYNYALYPVWILNTTWKDKKFVFAMNGQTGKLVGDLPVDKGLFWKFVGIWGISITVVLYVILAIFTLL